jgi:hypothetical protein
MRTRLLLAALLPLAVAACDSPPSAPAEAPSGLGPDFRSETVQVPLDENFSFVTPNPCNGEDVLVAGHVTGHIHFGSEAQDFENGVIVHTSFHLLATGTGTGLSTGATYLYHDNIEEHFESPNGPAPHASVGSQHTFRMISQGPEPDFRLTVQLHLNILPPDARFEVRVDREGEECAG